MISNRKVTNPIQGHPLTKQRRLLLDILRDADGHMDAKELYRRASTRDRSISQATVYRNLTLFKELGVVEEMRLDKIRCYYEIKQSSEHQHLICKGCGKVVEFSSPYFQKLVDAVQLEQNFKVVKAELYVEGYCQNCEGQQETG